MPFRTRDPVLVIEESRMRNIDPRDPENLFGMWSVFHKCSGILENGKRLENLSWRVFAHETLCISPERRRKWSATPVYSHHHAHSQPSSSMPALSSSVDSTASEDVEEVNDVAVEAKSPQRERPSFNDHTHTVDRRSRDKHITPLDLENLVISIKSKQELTRPISPLPTLSLLEEEEITPTKASQELDSSQHGSVNESLPTPRPSSPRALESSTSTIASDGILPSVASTTCDSETSAESDNSHSVVRGFRTGSRGASTYRSQSQLALAPSPRPITRVSEPESAVRRKRGGLFTLGGSVTEDEASVRDTLLSPNSGDSNGMSSRRQQQHQQKKHASFVDKVTEIPRRTFILPSSNEDDDNAIESDDDFDSDEEGISESAIEDDDDWEDENEPESGPKQLTFHRVDSKPNLTSRRSVITQGLHEGQRAMGMQHAASRLTPVTRRSPNYTPNGPSMPASVDERSPIDIQASAAAISKPIAVTPNTTAVSCPPPLSPRATRRNMLSSELGISLRKHMLNERQQKNAGYNAAAIQRRHTSYDLKNLAQYPDAGGDAEAGPSRDTGSSRNNSFHDYFDYGMGEYHQKGW